MPLIVPMRYKERDFTLAFASDNPDPDQREPFTLSGDMPRMELAELLDFYGMDQEFGLSRDMEDCASGVLLATINAAGIIFDWPESMQDTPGEIDDPEEVN